jgi:hypothetical protein
MDGGREGERASEEEEDGGARASRWQVTLLPARLTR